jgi:hypothetical protein
MNIALAPFGLGSVLAIVGLLLLVLLVILHALTLPLLALCVGLSLAARLC